MFALSAPEGAFNTAGYDTGSESERAGVLYSYFLTNPLYCTRVQCTTRTTLNPMKLRAGEKRGMGVLWFFSMLWLDGYRKIRPQYWHHTGSLLGGF